MVKYTDLNGKSTDENFAYRNSICISHLEEEKKITFLFLTPLKILPSSSYVSIDVVVGDGDNCIGIGSFLVQSEDLCMYFDGSDLDLESNV